MLNLVWFLTLLQYAASLEQCQNWGDWKESSKCLMPTNIESTVAGQCPQPHSTSTLQRRKKSFGNFFKSSLRCMPWNDENDIAEDSESSSATASVINMQGHSEPHTEAEKSHSHSSSVVTNHGEKNKTHNAEARSKWQKLWQRIYTNCGSCGLNVRCRTRKASSNCSSTIEVERTPCSAANMKPACQLGPQEYQIIENQINQKTLQTIKRQLKSSKTMFKKVPTDQQNGRRQLKSAQKWTKIRSFDQLVNGNVRKAKTTIQTSRVVSRMMQDTPLPNFNCVKSWKGCFCCCQPFVPIDGICQDVGAAAHINDIVHESNTIANIADGDDQTTTTADSEITAHQTGTTKVVSTATTVVHHEEDHIDTEITTSTTETTATPDVENTTDDLSISGDEKRETIKHKTQKTPQKTYLVLRA